MEPPSSEAAPPLFHAVVNSTKPLLLLLKAINLSNKVHVEIGEDGVRFAVDVGRVMQGVAYWNKNLFRRYTTNLPPASGDDGEGESKVSFQLSLPVLLETLQIFGASEAAARQTRAQADPYRSKLPGYQNNGWSNQALEIAGTCTFAYVSAGDRFRIVLDESRICTTCDLTTYMAEAPDPIPFDMSDLSFKVITQARRFQEALKVIAFAAPERVTMFVSAGRPYIHLTGGGGLGYADVDFAGARNLFETFVVHERWVQTFKFDKIMAAAEAMRVASKISLRGDKQGVLSLQLMVEIEGAGVNFLDFRFVPYADYDAEQQEDGIYSLIQDDHSDPEP